MKLSFDIKTTDGQEIKDCYFVTYKRYFKCGNSILSDAIDSVRCFDKNNQEIINLNLADATITRVVDEETMKDVTDIAGYLLSLKTMSREVRYIN
jgi:hypothetical protein